MSKVRCENEDERKRQKTRFMNSIIEDALKVPNDQTLVPDDGRLANAVVVVSIWLEYIRVRKEIGNTS